MQSLLLLLVLHLELLKFTLLLVDLVAEHGVHLLTGEELVDHLTDIGVSCSLLYLLESSLDSSILLHFLVHFPFQELTPEFLDHERIPLFYLVGVFGVVFGSLGDRLLTLETFLALLEGLILVLNTGFE